MRKKLELTVVEPVLKMGRFWYMEWLVISVLGGGIYFATTRLKRGLGLRLDLSYKGVLLSLDLFKVNFILKLGF
jgi:hypothetical protein